MFVSFNTTRSYSFPTFFKGKFDLIQGTVFDPFLPECDSCIPILVDEIFLKNELVFLNSVKFFCFLK